MGCGTVEAGGRKYGIGDYGLLTYDLGPPVTHPWEDAPIPPITDPWAPMPPLAEPWAPMLPPPEPWVPTPPSVEPWLSAPPPVGLWVPVKTSVNQSLDA